MSGDATTHGPAPAALPPWMRRALFAAAATNLGAAAAFVPGAGALRGLAGLPPDGEPLYLLTVGLFVLLFGIGYLWVALAGRPERLFIGLSALGKAAFFALLLGGWAAGSLPLRAPLLGSADLGFALLFGAWLVGARRP